MTRAHASALWLCLVMLGAGCGGSPTGGPCTLGSCKGGAVCDLTDPDGPTCISGDGDLDGDGIPNRLDFCNHQAGGEFDEDRDGLGDDCDPCPIAPPPENPDPDGDAVDAPCDPDPRTPGDTIALFEGFNGGIPSGWKTSPAWQVVGGAAVVTPGDSVTQERLTAPLPALSTHIAVLSAYRVDRVDTLATQNLAGVTATDRRPAGVSTVQCTGRRTGGTGDQLIIDSDRGTGTKAFTNLFNAASLYQVAQSIDNAQGACAMIADAEVGAVQVMTAGEAPSEAGVTARGAVVRFGYLLVIQRP